jgi:serine/threonine protein kinase/WD40 repeat protein
MDREQLLDEIATQYLKAVEAGAHPDPAEWLARYPGLAEELAELFADQQAMHQIAAPLRELAEPAPVNQANAVTLGPGETVAGAPAQLPKCFADFEILEEIARGGMGVVYKARQISLGRIVALKMILAGQFASVGDVRRFHAEAEAAGNLDHPHIVPIYEVGEHQGQRYFSMKFIEGGNLGAWLKARLATDTGDTSGSRSSSPSAVTASVALLATVARAVHHAHQRGILHRDLKPANILLDGHGQPNVTDFGLAKRIDKSGGATQSGSIVGTPAYMSQEQAAGKKDLTTATDVYSLGAILYECLTGRPPFQAETPIDTLLQVREGAPACPRSLNPRVNPDLETICLKCLDKDPVRRYGSAEALAEDLDRWQRGEPISARPVGRSERLWRWCRRNPLVATLSAAIILIAALGFAGVLGQWQVAVANENKANENAAQAKKNEQKANESAADAKQKAKEAEDERDTVKRQRDEIRKVNEQLRLAQEELRSTLYGAQMNLVQVAWETDDVARVRELLEKLRPRQGQTDLRSFEWHYWNRLSHAELRTVELGSQSPSAPAFSPDGTRLAAIIQTPVPDKPISFHSAVRVWETATGTQLSTTEGAADSINNVEFSPDGKRLAGVSVSGGEVKVWDAATAKTLVAFAFRGRVDELRFRSDGRRLAGLVKANDQKVEEIKVWDADNGRELASHPLAAGTDRKAVFSADGQRIAVIVKGKGKLKDQDEVKVFDTDTGKEIATCPMAFGEMVISFGALTFSPDAKRIAVAVARFDADILRAIEAIGPKGFDLKLHEQAMNSITGAVRMWDADNGKQLLTLKGIPATMIGLTFSPDGSSLAAIDGAAGALKVWDTITGKEKFTDPGRSTVASAGAVEGVQPSITPTGLVFSPDGKLLSATGFGTAVRVWDVGARQLRLNLKGHTSRVTAAAFSRDSKRLFSTGTDGTLKAWDATRVDGPMELKGVGDFMNRGALAVSPNGKHLALVDQVVDLKKEKVHYAVKMLDADTRKEHIAIQLKEGAYGVGRLTFSRNGRRLAGVVNSMSAKKSEKSVQEVKVWDAATGNELFSIKKLTTILGGLRALVFSPDGKRLAAAFPSVDDLKSVGHVEVWPIAAGSEPLTIPGGNLSWNLAFSPDGKHLAIPEVGKLGTTIVIRDAATGKQLRTFEPGPDNGGGQLAFSANGKYLAVAAKTLNISTGSTEVKVWHVDSGVARFDLKLSGQGFTMSVALSPDGGRLATNVGFNLGTGQTGNEVKLWDTGTGLELSAFKGQVSLPSSLAFSTDGTKLILTGDNIITNRLLLQIWDATPLPEEAPAKK